MSTPSQASRPSRPGQRPQSNGPNRTALIVGVVVVLVLVALVVALVAGGGDDGGDETSTGGSTPATAGEGGEGAVGASAVTVEGDALPQLEDPSDDPAVGEVVPSLSGTDIDGNPITIEPDGRAKMIVVLAHWCPHCQAELPLLVSMADAGAFEGIRTVAVLTGTNPDAPNYPPVPWLDREGWSGEIALDDPQASAAAAFGLSSYPFLVMLDADGTVVGRVSGEQPESVVQALVDAAS
jgi:thiol-disulfide isomerase/thioredoxin